MRIISSMKRYFIFLFILAVSTTTCRKKVEDVHPEYIGEWTGYGEESDDRQTITVDSTGWGKYFSNRVSDGYSGKARASNRVFSIGTHKFNIVMAITPIDTTVDTQAAQWYRENPYSCPMEKMKLRNPLFWGNNEVAFYRTR